MTFEWAHKKSHMLMKSLEKFKLQLEIIHPDAMLCYQSQYRKFTLSLYPSTDPVSSTDETIIATEHLNLLSSFGDTPAIQQLAKDITYHILHN